MVKFMLYHSETAGRVDITTGRVDITTTEWISQNINLAY